MDEGDHQRRRGSIQAYSLSSHLIICPALPTPPWVVISWQLKSRLDYGIYFTFTLPFQIMQLQAVPTRMGSILMVFVLNRVRIDPVPCRFLHIDRHSSRRSHRTRKDEWDWVQRGETGFSAVLSVNGVRRMEGIQRSFLLLFSSWTSLHEKKIPSPIMISQQVEDWSQCSVSCGRGEERRVVTCAAPHCPLPQPEAVRPCERGNR